MGKPRSELRSELLGLPRYIATVETTKHRVFQFLDASILPDNMLVVLASDDAFHLGVLSSRTHTTWAIRAGGWLGIGNDPRYSKSRGLDPFPFSDATKAQRSAIRRVAEELDAYRKRVLAEHTDLTLTGLYNVLDLLRQGRSPESLDADDRHVFDAGLVLILKELHDELDRAVAAAYGWPVDLPEEGILARLVALNRERAAEEARGVVRWLRPDYQIPRFGAPTKKAKLDLTGTAPGQEPAAAGKPAFPAEDVAQTAAIMAAFATASTPIDSANLAARFKQGKRVEPKITATLAALARMGFIVPANGGGAFILRRSA